MPREICKKHDVATSLDESSFETPHTLSIGATRGQLINAQQMACKFGATFKPKLSREREHKVYVSRDFPENSPGLAGDYVISVSRICQAVLT